MPSSSSDRPWLRHYDPWVPHHLSYLAHPLTYILDTAAAEQPDGIATQFLGAALTFAQLKQHADRLAAALRQLGVAAGDRVGIMLPNCPQYIVTVFGVLRLGAVVVNLNPSYTPRELGLAARDAGLSVLVTLDRCLPAVRQVLAEAPIARVIVTALTDYGRSPAAAPDGDAAAMPSPTGDELAFSAVLAMPAAPLAAGPDVSPDDLAVLQYTGGTTGVPKGAMLTHASIFANVQQTTAFMYPAVRRGVDRYLMVIPYFHIYGFTVGMMRGLWVGATQMLLPKYDAAEMLDAIRAFRPGVVPAVPTIYVSLLSHPLCAASGLDRVRMFHTGGAPCPVDVIERFERATGRPLNEGYGLSESSPVICTTPQQAVRKPGTVGLPLPDTDIDIVDLETGTERLPIGEVGELRVAGPQVMRGYWQQPDETAHALRTDAAGRRWLYTGDIARLDDDGFVTIVQRKKDVIIVDAFKVYPSEVEAVLTAHPQVRMAAVVGVPDDYHGEVVRASLVLEPGATLTREAIVAHCRAQLAPYKVPRQIDIRDALPTSAVGKILYRVLRDEAPATGSAS